MNGYLLESANEMNIINPYRFAGGGGPPSFDPDSISGLLVWLDADAITGPFHSERLGEADHARLGRRRV